MLCAAATQPKDISIVIFLFALLLLFQNIFDLPDHKKMTVSYQISAGDTNTESLC